MIVRGNKRQRVFRREEDFRLYLRLLGGYKEVFDFVLCAYALMPTHVHLLVEVRDRLSFGPQAAASVPVHTGENYLLL